MQPCPRCSKQLPSSVRFCAYCGADLPRRPWRAWLDTLTLPASARPAIALGAAGALMGAGVGGLLGQLLGDPSAGDVWLGGLVGAAGMGIASAWGDTLAAGHLDRDRARRFGQVFGGAGGALAFIGGVVVVMLILWQAGQAAGLQPALAFVAAHFRAGLYLAFGGGFLGAATGILAGRFAARVGYQLLQRRGAIIGAALAWTLGSIIGGLFVGNRAATLVGGDPVAGALLGMVLQVGLGALVLTQAQRLARGWRLVRRMLP